MTLREALGPRSVEGVALGVVAWALPSAGMARVLDESLGRWEVLLGAVVAFGWGAWAINYRLEETASCSNEQR